MSRSSRTKTPTFRFNRNDDDLLEEVIESNECLQPLKDQTSDAAHLTQDDSRDAESRESQSTTKIDRSVVKDFISSRLNKTKSLDEDQGIKEPVISSNWFHDIKGKIKEKIEEKKREKELRQLTNESDVCVKDITIDAKHSSTESHHSSHDLSLNFDYDLISTIDSISTEWKDLDPSPQELIEPSLERFADESVEVNSWSYSQTYYLIAIGSGLAAFLISITSPLPSFISGLIFGSIFTLITLSIIIVFIVSKFLLKKSHPKKHQKRYKSFETKQTNGEIFKGWMHEFIGNYEDRDSDSGFKTQLVYVRLQGSNLRLSKPKQDIRKLKLDSTSLPIFISQRIFDLSKMSFKRVFLLIPKSVKNQKKYIWSKKYPICLEMENMKSKSVDKLVLFIRNCREKEEWFWRLRETINSNLLRTSKDDNEISLLSDPSTPKSKDFKDLNAEIESLPRTQSLDFGSLQSATTYSSASNSPTSPTKELQILSKHIDYHIFMKNILSFKPSQTSSLLWFNALINRVCFDILNEEFWSNYVAAKIQRKLRRLRLPYFMESLTITEIDLGNTLPTFNNVPKPPVVDDRGLWIDFEITYSGGFTMTLETKLNLMKLKEQGNGSQEMRNFQHDIEISDNESDSIVTSSDEELEEKPVDPDDADNSKKQQKLLKFVDKIASSQYFQKATENKYIKRAMEGVSKTALILTVQIQTLNGTLAINIPQPPTDRLWYGFRGNPDLVLSARPKLGEHEVSIHQVTDIIERKLRAEFAKVLVMPNMDDLIIPVLKTNIDQYITVVP